MFAMPRLPSLEGPTFLACAALFCASGCGGSGVASDANPPVPWPVVAFPELPDTSGVPEARIELGRMLFYDGILSTDEQTSCATCHSDKWTMADGLRRSIGHGAGLRAGPHRSGSNVGRRNSPPLFNLAFRETLLWDGGATTLEEQAMMPLEAEDELGIEPEVAAAKIVQIPEYVELFEAAFPDDPRVTVRNMASALAALQRTMVSKRALYDSYVAGDTAALDEEAVEGMFRFAEQGCDGCHTPPLFESETFANRHVPGVEGVEDDGLMEITGDERDRGKFRTPPLRNVAFTSPFFHNGSVRPLENVVRHELEQSGNPFTDEDVSLITHFVAKALNDERAKPDRPRRVPSGLPIAIDSGT